MTVTAQATGTMTFNTATGFWTITPGIAGTGTSGTPNGGLATAYQANPGNPTGTTSATYVMMGLGGSWTLTPLMTGNVKLHIVGSINNSGANTSTVQLAYGTSSAPNNGAAASGTVVGNATSWISISGIETNGIPFCLSVIIRGLTVSTAYWFDAQLKSSSGTASILNLTVIAEEIW
jgi:hypothetical protein